MYLREEIAYVNKMYYDGKISLYIVMYYREEITYPCVMNYISIF